MLIPLRDNSDSPDAAGKADFPALLAATVHDLKNSVGILLNTLNEADTETPGYTAGVSDLIGRLRHEAAHINNDLVALLAVYKLDHGHYPLNIDHHRVSDVIEECVLQYAPLLKHGNITVETCCPTDLYWFFDRSLTIGIISNALDNALRHTRDRLVIGTESNTEGLTVSVHDNGPGYPDHLLASPLPTGGIDFMGNSTGLGLYFAALAAGQHRNRQRAGTVTLSNGSRLGGGCFQLHLP